MKYQPEHYWSDLFSQGVNAQSVCYPDWPLSYNRFLHRQQFEKLEKLLDRHHIDLQGKSILEIGPGSGFWTSFFRHGKPSDYTGLDISEASVMSLTERYPEFSFRQADIGAAETIQHIPENLDLVYAAMVFLHITDNERLSRAFETICGHLSPGGHLIFLDAIYTRNVFGSARKQADTPDFDPQFHNKIRPLSFYQALGDRHGLDILEVFSAFNSSQYCFDFKNRLSYLIWGKAYYALHRRILTHAGEKTGKIYADFQAILDRLLTDYLHLGMSSKWVVMKKKLVL